MTLLYTNTQGLNYPCASKVPVQHRRQAFSSVMNTLAKLHGRKWVHGEAKEKSEYLESAQFFHHQVYMGCVKSFALLHLYIGPFNGAPLISILLEVSNCQHIMVYT